MSLPEKAAPSWAGPLQGIRVLDFTRVLAGPSASLALADLGAEVLKIERPGTGDETRLYPPLRDDESHYFLSVNRGKKSIVVDLKKDAGVALAKALAAKCDILIENFLPGVMDRFGLGYEALSTINPRLIYCAISGTDDRSAARPSVLRYRLAGDVRRPERQWRARPSPYQTGDSFGGPGRRNQWPDGHHGSVV